MAQLCSSQKALSERILKLYTNTKKTSKSRFTRGYLETRAETLENYWIQYKQQHDSITTTITASDLLKFEFDATNNFDATEEVYLDLMTLIKDSLCELTRLGTSSNSLNRTMESEPAVVKTKLPHISIPKFSGNYNDWMSFKDLFTSLIRKNEHISNIEKYHYLKTSLTGEAEQLLKHFALTEVNYDKAWKTLESRYDNKRMIVTTIISRLVNQKKMSTECSRSLKEILDTTKECLNSLDNLEVDTSTWDAIVVHLVVSKLDIETHKQWEHSLGSSQDIPTFESLSSFLEGRFRSMEMINTTFKKDPPPKRDLVTKTTPHKPAHVKTFVTEVNSECTYCAQNHYICHCKDFAQLDVPQRQDFIKKNGICFNCLVKGHSVNTCRQSTTCRKCNRRHHTLLHSTTLSKNPPVPDTNHPASKPETSTSIPTVTAKAEVHNEQVILATAQIAAQSRNNDTIILRALIDQGSQASFITEAAAQLLNLERVSVNGKITGISSATLTTKSMVNLKFHAVRDSSHLLTAEAYVLKRLTSLLPSQEFPADTWPSFEQSELADPHFHKPGSIDVLLGADVHAHIILDGIRRHNSLLALNSRLGWLISGRITQTDSKSHHVVVMHTQVEVDQLLRQFWEIDEYIPNKKPLSQLETQCEEHFMKTHTRNADGRYKVCLPFKDEDTPNLGNSRSLAVNRLLQMEKRFKHKPEFQEEYCKFMRQYESLGHMEIVPEKEHKNEKVYYLPHHAIIRESSLSTKLRVVFDGSAKPANGNSLNDELLIGPPLQQEIRDLVTRWRQHKFCLVADIQQMYRQILISQQDIDYQRIMWRETPNEDIKEYRLLTVTYGTSCAPYLAIKTLHQLADDEREDFPEAEILKTDLYMDDLMTGSSTEEDALTLQRRLTELFKRGGFLLHKWSSNSETVLSEIPEANKALQSVINIKMDDSVKALGIAWKPQSDTFELIVNLSCDNDVITKRNVLSAIAKTFDPLGWLAPLVIVLKIFMQKLWLAGLGWDDELNSELKAEWITYLRNFENMNPILLPRWLGTGNMIVKVELHGFSDASCVAYSAVVYTRVITDNEIKVNLVAAKTKVAPVKQISLPRLELCGAVLLSKLIQTVKLSLNIDDDCIFAWTDSTIVLSWLRKSPNTWKPFVGNRTTEILNVTNSSQWHHVKSADNPADCASRGVSPADLEQSQLWWKGPQFLRESEVISYPNFDVPETTLEMKPKAKASHVCATENEASTYLNRYSSLLRLIRVTAYCFRFVNLCKNRRLKNDENSKLTYLTTNELRHALKVCIRLSQSMSFEHEIRLLGQGKYVSKKSKIHTLNPILDDEKILRVGGRLVNAQIPFDMKSPVILMQTCNLARLIVLDAHLRTLHGRNVLMLNLIHQRYWIIGAKHLVKKVIRLCKPCFSQQAKPTAPLMGNLPQCRVQPSRPFLSSGVDYAGPFTLKLYSGRCTKTCKAYISVFLCMVTKAIHLELVSSLSSAAFLAAFKRFTARRGHCQDIWSDCGTNFVGASKELNLMFKNSKSSVVEEISQLLANDNTTWHFIPPGAPNFGGLWEAGVKSIKGHLKRVIGESCLTFEEFNTLLTQVEACVNSRPLTLMSSNDDELPLTPGHFLIGEAPIAIPEERVVDAQPQYLNRWQKVQRMVQSLWRRWQSEYLTMLQHRYKWSQNQPDVEIGTLVLVKDDRLPPGKWLLGRVVAKHPGADGITRVVSLRFKNHVFKRPVTKICPLPLDASAA